VSQTRLLCAQRRHRIEVSASKTQAGKRPLRWRQSSCWPNAGGTCRISSP
jgi:hypothetical protein